MFVLGQVRLPGHWLGSWRTLLEGKSLGLDQSPWRALIRRVGKRTGYGEGSVGVGRDMQTSLQPQHPLPPLQPGLARAPNSQGNTHPSRTPDVSNTWLHQEVPRVKG